MKTSMENLINTKDNTMVFEGISNYKGMTTPIRVGNYTLQPLPLEAEEIRNRRVDSRVRGKIYARSYVPAAVFPQAIGKEWARLGYRPILDIAKGKCEYQGIDIATALHKATWQILMNQPSLYVFYTNKITTEQFSIIRFCLTNGIDIKVYDEFTNAIWEFKAIGNKSMCPLYQGLYYPEDSDYVAHLYRVAVEKFESKLYEDYNNAISELSAEYFVANLEAYPDRIAFAKRFSLQDYLKEIGVPYSVDCFIYEVYPQMLNEVAIWARAFDIDINTNIPQTTVDTYYIWRSEYQEQEKLIDTRNGIKRFRQTIHTPVVAAPGYAGNNYKDYWEYSELPQQEIDPKLFALKKQVQMKSQSTADVIEVIRAYQQIVFYNENGVENFMRNDYFVCENCGYPVHEIDEYCPYCGKEYNPIINVNKAFYDEYKGYDPHFEDYNGDELAITLDSHKNRLNANLMNSGIKQAIETTQELIDLNDFFNSEQELAGPLPEGIYQGTVTKVERAATKDHKEYYKLSIDIAERNRTIKYPVFNKDLFLLELHLAGIQLTNIEFIVNKTLTLHCTKTEKFNQFSLIPKKPITGEYKAIFKGVQAYAAFRAIVVSYEISGILYRDIRAAATKEDLNKVIKALTGIALQLNAFNPDTNMFTPAQLNKHIGSEMTVAVVKLEEYKSTFLNYMPIEETKKEETNIPQF